MACVVYIYNICNEKRKNTYISPLPPPAISAASDSQTQLKARHDQIRVTNISAELSAMQERTEARARRQAEIKSLLAENDALSALSHVNHDRTLGNLSLGHSERREFSLGNHELASTHFDRPLALGFRSIAF